MAETKLPPPMHVGDFYLAAILDELKGMRADLAGGSTPVIVQNGPVELREGVDAIAAVEAAGQELGHALAGERVLAPPKPKRRRSRR